MKISLESARKEEKKAELRRNEEVVFMKPNS